ncbi:hypothetical protein SRHO_G00335570 [Serrasalmus rhombeus]
MAWMDIMKMEKAENSKLVEFVKDGVTAGPSGSRPEKPRPCSGSGFSGKDHAEPRLRGGRARVCHWRPVSELRGPASRHWCTAAVSVGFNQPRNGILRARSWCWQHVAGSTLGELHGVGEAKS